MRSAVALVRAFLDRRALDLRLLGPVGIAAIFLGLTTKQAGGYGYRKGGAHPATG